MSNIQFNVTVNPSTEILARAFAKPNINAFLRAEINRLAASVERFSKQLTPVRTGALRASINFTPASTMLQSVVSTHKDYAVYVHEGTKYMRSRPFMKYGAMFAQIGVEKQIASRLDREFTEAFKIL